MGYEVVFILQIHSCFAAVSSSDAWLERKFNLPFIPQINIRYVDGEWEGIPIEINYDIKQKLFRCYVEADKEIYEAQLHQEKARNIEEIIKEYTDLGWYRKE